MPIAFRPAASQDFDYCKRLYFAEMNWIIEALHLDRVTQEIGFQHQWNPTQVRILTLNGADIGWLQSFTQANELFLGQLIVERAFQRRGIGTEVVKRLICEAARLDQAMRLNVVKINPAVRLYERLGFKIMHEDDRKFYLKLDRDMFSDLS